MVRNGRLVIRLTTGEKEAIMRLARRERLAPSTLARKMLLDLAEAQGVSFVSTDSRSVNR